MAGKVKAQHGHVVEKSEKGHACSKPCRLGRLSVSVTQVMARVLVALVSPQISSQDNVWVSICEGNVGGAVTPFRKLINSMPRASLRRVLCIRRHSHYDNTPYCSDAAVFSILCVVCCHYLTGPRLPAQMLNA